MQAPVRQFLRVPVTPKIADLIFTQVEDCSRKVFPAYGTAHPNATVYPNHKLVLIRPNNAQGASDESFLFTYAADRASQDDYNFEHVQADYGGEKYDLVRRTYVTPRASYDPASPANGAAMPTGPSGKFPVGYVLAGRQETRIGDEALDSLYVAEVRTYIYRTNLSYVKLDLRSGRSKESTVNLYYRGETVSGTAIETLAASPTNSYWGLQSDGTFRELRQLSEDWFEIEESNVLPEGATNSLANPAKVRMIERVTPLGTDVIFHEVGAMPSPEPTYGSAHYDTTNWPNHKLAYIEPIEDGGGKLYRFWYVADRASQDNYNFEHTQADIGGTKFNAVKRTYVTLRSSYSPTSPAQGSTMSTDPSAKFASDFILAGRENTRIGQPYLDNLYVSEVRTYVQRTTIIRYDFDEFSGTDLKTTQALYYRGETVTGPGVAVETVFANNTSSYFGLQSSGVYREGEQLTANWFAVLEREVIPNGFTRTYTASVNYSWPPVLSGIEIMDWVLKNGATRNYVRPTFSKEGYSGPCKATIVESWSLTPATVGNITPMKPLPIHYPSPILPVSIDSCLHAAVVLVSDTGTNDPVYGFNTGSSRTFAATTPTDWPSTITASDDQRPFRGGYLRTVVTVSAPS